MAGRSRLTGYMAGLVEIETGPYKGLIVEKCAGLLSPEKLARLANPGPLEMVSERRHGRNAHFCIGVPAGGCETRIWVKSFSRQFLMKDWIDAIRGSKAQRTFLFALHLKRSGVGTPAPIGYLERWQSGRLKESYYLSECEVGIISFKDALVAHFKEDPSCEKIMRLLETVAHAIADMHRAGFLHNDLGNQNIFLRKRDDGSWGDVIFMDLNRGRIRTNLSLRERARDISRIYLPSDLLRVFKEMYFRGEKPPRAFQRWEKWHRGAYALHSRTRAIRHPFRFLMARERSLPDYPPEKEMWVWDERSAQPINVMRARERFLHLSLGGTGVLLFKCALRTPSVWRESVRLLEGAFTGGVDMTMRVGMALDPKPETVDRQIELIGSWGPIPVFVRIMHHEGEYRWSECVTVIRKLKRLGYPVSVALVQDRAAVREPARWRSFVLGVSEQIWDQVEWVEACHAINRVKWGIWDYSEYERLMEPVAEAARKYPSLSFMGPAGIDYEYLFVMAALRSLPKGFRFRALSHHLYVDRRGAPENRQGPSSLLEKCAQARALARISGVCDDRLIISETGWPLLGTGVYSPVTSPYESPGPRRADPSVSEDTYADYMLRYLAIAVGSGLAERVYWWRLVARGFGLVDDTNPKEWRPRPAFHAMSFFLRLLGKAVLEGREEPLSLDGTTPLVDRSKVFCLRFRTADNEVWAMCWSAAGEVRARIAGAECVLDVFGKPLRVHADGALSLGSRPLYVRLIRPE